ncbi:hypothetical protein WJX84_007532, partial [Apatococcus fuscideae]
MLQNKSFVRKTKKGGVLKVVNQHYLRDDIYSGSSLDPDCDAEAYKLSADAAHYLVIDTNLALHQMDFLEHPAVDDVVVPGTVLEECRKRNSAAYQRLRALCSSSARRFYVFSNEHHRETYIQAQPAESPNDRNDRAIRVATAWYMKRIPGKEVILLTADADNRRKAVAEGVRALSVQAYARLRTDCPELVDVGAVVMRGGQDDDETDMVIDGAASNGRQQQQPSDGPRQAKRRRIYDEHMPMSEVTAGIKAGRLHQGPIRMSRSSAFQAWVSSESAGEDIQVQGREAVNRALDGDIVAVRLLTPAEAAAASKAAARRPQKGGGADAHPEEASGDEDDGEPWEDSRVAEVTMDDVDEKEVTPGSERVMGRVVGIIRRNWRTRGYCGSLKDEEAGKRGRQQSRLFCPVERRFPLIRLVTRQAETLSGQRIVVVVDGWEADSLHPVGHYVRKLGTIGDKDTETEVLLIENDINTSPFTPGVHACVPPLPWSIQKSDWPGREDFRELPICSVDPPGCRDIDDALHVRPLPSGNFEVGVHIADVTHFLKPGTPMDEEAAARSTTTYLVQRRIDMLPKPLTEDICSLRGGVERLAFSVIWEMTPQADAVSVRFTKSVICSKAALSYAEAQARMDDERLHDEITVGLRRLNSMAKIMRARRFDQGALALASPEVKFEMDTETLDPLDVAVYQIREANQMVEEMMLLANVTVAEHILAAFPACSLLRSHATPAPKRFQPLVQAGVAAGFDIDFSSSKALAVSLDKAERPGDGYFNRLVRIMATRCMMQALYFSSGTCAPSEYHHYGLAAPLYTHFTSPIRRYADVVVHRLLAASLRITPLPESARDSQALQRSAGNMNMRHRNAQMAGRASAELHTLIFFKARAIVSEARVLRVRPT